MIYIKIYRDEFYNIHTMKGSKVNMADKYNELINTMIEKGADPKIFDMPVIRERIENGMIKDMSVNSDGTIDFNGYHMKREKNNKGITIERFEEQNGEVHYAMDDPIGDNGYALYKMIAEKISINEYGIEEKMEIKEDESISKNNWENTTFDKIKAPIKIQIIRKDGKILKYDTNENEYSEKYDDGNWKIESDPIKNEYSSNKKIKDIVLKFEANVQKYTEKYPQLKEYYSKKRNEILDDIDNKQEKLITQNNSLKDNNSRLQKMLEKTLGFAEKVRNSVVGKIFFGKSANEILGEKTKNVAFLEDGENERD